MKPGGGSSVMECEASEVERRNLVGGVGAGGGACPLKARDTVRCTQYPLDWELMSNSPAREENGATGVQCVERRERWSGAGMDNVEVQSLRKEKNWGGGEKMRLPNESKAVGL